MISCERVEIASAYSDSSYSHERMRPVRLKTWRFACLKDSWFSENDLSHGFNIPADVECRPKSRSEGVENGRTKIVKCECNASCRNSSRESVIERTSNLSVATASNIQPI